MKFKLLMFLCSFLSIFNINCMTFEQTIFKALHDDDRQKLYKFLNKVEDVNTRTFGGITLLHQAALTGKTDIAEWLILRGANVNAVDKMNLTPLHQAAHQSNTEIMNLLLKNKANPNAINISGDSPLHSLFIGKFIGKKPSIDAVRLLLEYGADPRIRDVRGTKAEYFTEDQAIINLLNAAEEELDRKDAEKKSEEVSAASEPSSDKGDKKEA